MTDSNSGSATGPNPNRSNEALRPDSRRDFLKTGAVLGGALAAGGLATFSGSPAAHAKKLREASRGKVVGVQHAAAMKSMAKENARVVKQMTNTAMLRFTGKRTLAKAWREIVAPSDIVGVKLNCLAAPGMSTSPAMVEAIVKGLNAAGVTNERIYLYEQYEARLLQRGSGFALNSDPAKGPMVVHLGGRSPLTDDGLMGYEKSPSKHGSGPSCYSNLLKHCTAIINAPVIKDHNLAGVTVGMKNMTHGNIHNPQEYHEHDCNPQIAHIYDHPRIKDKVRLVVCDALKVQFDGGPQDSRHKVLHNRIYVSADPVAIDSWGLKLVNDIRKEKKKKPLADRHPGGNYLVRAEKLGLGVFDISKITCDVHEMA